MRHGLLIASTLALLGAGLVVAPASAGDDHWVAVRAIDDRFEVVGQDCSAQPADPPTVKVGVSDVHARGRGSASVTTADDTLGGVLVRDPRPLHGVFYHVWTAAGDDPASGQWRVDLNGDTLLSDPVHLEREQWSSVALDDAVLHGPDGWRGSIDEYLAAFGKGDHWTAGLLTGSCLNTGEVWLDGIGTRRALYDFEPRTWVTVRVSEAGPPYDGSIDAGDRFVVRGVAHRWDTRTDSAVSVPGADILLQRQWRAPEAPWRTVVHAATYRGTAYRSALWRAVWHRPSGSIPSDYAYQSSVAHASDARVDGRPCRPDPDVVPLPPTCKTMRVDAGTVTFSGTGDPPGTVQATVVAHSGDYDGPVVDQGQAVVGRHGTWQVPIGTGDLDHLYVEVDIEPTSMQHELSGGGRMRFPLEVR